MTRAEAVADPHWTGSLTLGSGWALFIGMPGESSRHVHHAWQVCVATEGAIEIDGDEEHPALAIAIPSGAPHAVRWRASPGALLYLEPTSVAGRTLAAAVARRGRVAPVDGEELGLLRARILTLERRRGAVDPDAARSLRDACLSLFCRIDEGGLPLPDPRIVAVTRAIRERIDEPRIPARDLARSVDLSTSHLSALFRRQTGVALRPFILWTRLEAAVARASSGRSLTEIALETGFADSAHLARTFRRMFGTTPSRGLMRLDVDTVD